MFKENSRVSNDEQFCVISKDVQTNTIRLEYFEIGKEEPYRTKKFNGKNCSLKSAKETAQFVLDSVRINTCFKVSRSYE